MYMKVVAVTGATSGIGLAVCDALLGGGYAVIGAGRGAADCAAAREHLQAKHPGGRVIFLCADLMEQRETLRLAGEITAHVRRHFDGRLHALVNNAGCVRSWYATTGDGWEQQFALNYLAGFLLTHALLPLLRHGEARVIFTGSQSHKWTRVRWKDPMFARRYRPLLAYKQSSLMRLLLAHALNTRGLRAYGVDPGLVNTDIGCKDTGGLIHWVWSRRKRHGVPPGRPAKTYLTLCDKTPDGLYFHDSAPQKTGRAVGGKNAERLYALSARLCGLEGCEWG
jgi:NAD(P)-dependent dehydrogenase (short-subunit alcohol dehydrogenase family)